jgi:hypothetical protein
VVLLFGERGRYITPTTTSRSAVGVRRIMRVSPRHRDAGSSTRDLVFAQIFFANQLENAAAVFIACGKFLSNAYTRSPD